MLVLASFVAFAAVFSTVFTAVEDGEDSPAFDSVLAADLLAFDGDDAGPPRLDLLSSSPPRLTGPPFEFANLDADVEGEAEVDNGDP